MIRCHHGLVFCLGILLPCVIAGCAGAEGDEERVPVYPVKGKVTFAGAPLPNAYVTFSPVNVKPNENRPAATGKTNAQGEYALRTYDDGDGAAAGDYVVLVTTGSSSGGQTEESAHAEFMKGGGAPAGHGGGDSGSKSSLPEKYANPESSDLKATVTPDSEDKPFDFKLTP